MCTRVHECLLEEICSLTFFPLLSSSLSLPCKQIRSDLSLSQTLSRQCHAFLPPHPLLDRFLFLFSPSISSSLSACLCSTSSRLSSRGGSDGCSVSSTMETQSGSGGEELKAMGHTRAADAKEDLQESRRIERFDIPLSNLKNMFENPAMQNAVSKCDVSSVSECLIL